MTTSTDTRRLNEATVTIAAKDAEIRRLTEENFTLRAEIQRLTKEDTK